MSIRESLRRVGGPSLLTAALVVGAVGGVAGQPPEPRRDYIVTLDVADADRALRTDRERGRQRLSARAGRARESTRRLERAHGFRVRHRYTAAVAGFSARLTARQAARLRRDPSVASIRPALRFRPAAQTIEPGMERTRAVRSGGPHPDVDVDVAVLDTGVGPVGGGELDVRGGINCSGDGLGAGAYEDVSSSRHGTHVAGIVAARDNAIGTIGVAPGARIWSVRVFTASDFGSEATIICGLDWVVATHGGSPPVGSQPIEVVNMSIQGPRSPIGPQACGVPGDPDAMHVAICSVHATGATIVAAAGNSGRDAFTTSPAAYDQTITVAAMNDYDGRNGSKGTACAGWTSQRDDRFATYSNFGESVDVVAPGTCVRSTTTSASGDATRLLTGTSMATPHVAGAVARYLEAHPGTSPTMMKKIVKAAGRLDWVTSSDPEAGPVPLRLLDVQAVTGGSFVRPWVMPTRAMLGAGRPKETFRVHLQRYGGYAGDVTIDVAGLPDGVIDGGYDPSATLSGLMGLTTRMTLTSAPGGEDFAGTVRVRARGPDGEPSGGRDIDLVNDRSGPAIEGPDMRIQPGGRKLRRGNRMSVRFRWQAEDIATSVRTSRLQRRRADGSWQTVSSGRRSTTATSLLRPNRAERYRVRATDLAGNKSFSGETWRISVRDSSSARITQAGPGWQERGKRSAIGRSLLSSSDPSAALVSTFSGTGVAVVAPRGPKRGWIRVRVDDGQWTTVKLKKRRPRARTVVYSRSLGDGEHTIEIRPLSGSPAIDAILIVRS